MVERYRHAMEDRDATTLLSLAHPNYYEDSGTPSGGDDYGYEGLKEVLSKRLGALRRCATTSSTGASTSTGTTRRSTSATTRASSSPPRWAIAGSASRTTSASSSRTTASAGSSSPACRAVFTACDFCFIPVASLVWSSVSALYPSAGAVGGRRDSRVRGVRLPVPEASLSAAPCVSVRPLTSAALASDYDPRMADDNMKTRPPLKSAIARQLRQEAGFGCCICGMPFIEYHHIDGWENTGDDPARMMALCPYCHARATANAFPKDKQYEAKAAPFNVQQGWAGGPLHVGDQPIAVALGQNQFVGEGQTLLIDDHVILQLERGESGELLLSFDMFDDKDQLLVSVIRNEWITGDPVPWDLEYKFNWLRLRRKLRDITLEVDASSVPLRVRGTFWRHGVLFRVTERVITAAAQSLVTFKHLAMVNMSIHLYSDGHLDLKPATGDQGFMINEGDPAERLMKALAKLRQLRP